MADRGATRGAFGLCVGLCAPCLSSRLVGRLNGAWCGGFRVRGLSLWAWAFVRADALTVGGGIANGGRRSASRRGGEGGAHIPKANKGRDVGKARAGGRKADAGEGIPSPMRRGG